MEKILRRIKDRLTFKARANGNNTKVILLIDDNDENLSILKSILSKKKHKTLIAKTTMDGLKIAERHNPNLIIMNSHISGEKSLKLCEHLKNNRRTKQIPILIIEHKRGDANVAEYYDNKIDGYLVGPVDSQELVREIEGLIGSE